MTADPSEHLKRANALLNKKQNSLLLYAALEIRFALERMTQSELINAEKATRKSLDWYEASKKRRELSRISNGKADVPNDIIMKSKVTGEKVVIGEYKPLDLNRVKKIQGRLGDLLHPKVGLMLGIWNDPWYLETRRFLLESHKYLSELRKDNLPYYYYENLDHIEMVPKSDNS